MFMALQQVYGPRRKRRSHIAFRVASRTSHLEWFQSLCLSHKVRVVLEVNWCWKSSSVDSSSDARKPLMLEITPLKYKPLWRNDLWVLRWNKATFLWLRRRYMTVPGTALKQPWSPLVISPPSLWAPLSCILSININSQPSQQILIKLPLRARCCSRLWGHTGKSVRVRLSCPCEQLWPCKRFFL